MKANESILTEDKFKEDTKLFPQNTVDGTKLVDEPTQDIIPNSLFVVTPCMGTLVLSYVKSVLELQAICLSKKISVKVHMVQSSLVTQGRNLCVQAFLNSHCSHIGVDLASDVRPAFAEGIVFSQKYSCFRIKIGIEEVPYIFTRGHESID